MTAWASGIQWRVLTVVVCLGLAVGYGIGTQLPGQEDHGPAVAAPTAQLSSA
jgi:hypothetical protein